MKLNNRAKIIIVAFCLVVSVIGFMIKLPHMFRGIDKEMHALFYFLAAAVLNILFTNNKIFRHIVIGVVLYVFGLTIEYAQELSNKILHARIHGRFDPEDAMYNLWGLLAFSGLWIVFMIARLLFFKNSRNNSGNL